MDKHSKAYEQFCCVLDKNIIMEETYYHNGTKSVVCTHLNECTNNGGCKNKLLKILWEKN